MTFTQKFDKYACQGDNITTEVDGFTVTARIEYDTDYYIDDDDCHNPDQNVTGCNDEQHDKLMRAREAWLKGDWFYCGIVLAVSKNGVYLDSYAASLWGIECNYPNSDNDYLTDVANELLPKALDAGKAIIAKLCA